MPAWTSSMKMTQRQSQKMLLKQIPGMVPVLKLRERLFSASGNDLEEFLLQFTQTNRFLTRSANDSPGDTLLFPRFLGDTKNRVGKNISFDIDRRSVTDILESTVASSSTLKKTLTEQLHWERLSSQEIEIGELLISGLDANGYWIRDSKTGETFLESEIRRAPETRQLLEKVVTVIRRLDPPGAAVKNRFESAAVIAADNPEYNAEAVRFYRRLFDLTELGTDWSRIPQILNEEFGVDTVEAIGKMPVPQPPGSDFEQNEDSIPDAVAVIDESGTVSVSVPSDRLFQRLQLSNENPTDAQDAAQLRTAEAVLYTVAERCRLLKSAVVEILKRQLPFLLQSDSRKSRLTQTQIAEALEIDRPKLSRLLKNKSIEIKIKTQLSQATERVQTTPLTSFFDRSGSGENSKEEIIAAMQKLSARHGAVSDLEMSRLLHSQGIDIHRRTVCKYRSQIKSIHSGGNHGTIHSRNSL